MRTPQPDVLGTLSVGFLLDDAFAGQLKEITGSDIAFGMNGQVLSSTLPHDLRAALSPLMRERGPVRNVLVGGEEFAALPLDLSAGEALVDGDGPVAGHGPPGPWRDRPRFGLALPVRAVARRSLRRAGDCRCQRRAAGRPSDADEGGSSGQ